MITKAQAKYEALAGAVSVLRNHGFTADPADYPRDADRQKISAEFSAVIAGLEKQANKQRDLLAKKGINL